MSNTDILLSRPRVLVVGFGSAGQRHAKNAMMLGYHVEVVTSSDISEYHYYHTLNLVFFLF